MQTSPLDFLRNYIPAKMIGAIFMLSWAISFSSAMAIAKSLHPGINSIVLMFMRYVFGLVFFSPFILKSGLIKGYYTKRPLLHFLRIFFVIIAMSATYYAYRNLPLNVATSIGMTGPLFTTMLAILVLKEKVMWQKWGVILLGYFGVIIIMRPGFVPIETAIWVELIANLFAAASIVTVKILSRTESTFTIMLYSNTVTTILTGIAALSLWHPLAYEDLVKLFFIGGLGVLSQYCSVTALRYANPSFLAPFEYTRLCFAIPVGYLLFQEIPTSWTLLGSGVIILATWLLTRLEMQNSTKA